MYLLLLTIITCTVLFPGCTTKEVYRPSGYYYTLTFYSQSEVNNANSYAMRTWEYCGSAFVDSKINRLLVVECCVNDTGDSANYLQTAIRDATNLTTTVFKQRLQDKDKALQGAMIKMKVFFCDSVTGAIKSTIDYTFSFPELVGYIG